MRTIEEIKESEEYKETLNNIRLHSKSDVQKRYLGRRIENCAGDYEHAMVEGIKILDEHSDDFFPSLRNSGKTRKCVNSGMKMYQMARQKCTS